MDDELFDWVLPQGKPWDKKPEWIEGKGGSVPTPGKQKKKKKNKVAKPKAGSAKPAASGAAKPARKFKLTKTPSQKKLKQQSPPTLGAVGKTSSKKNLAATGKTPSQKKLKQQASTSSAPTLATVGKTSSKKNLAATGKTPSQKKLKQQASTSGAPTLGAVGKTKSQNKLNPASTSGAPAFVPPSKPVPSPQKPQTINPGRMSPEQRKAWKKQTKAMDQTSAPQKPPRPGKASSSQKTEKVQKPPKEGKTQKPGKSQKPSKDGKPPKEGVPQKPGKSQKPSKEGDGKGKGKSGKEDRRAQKQKRNEKVDKANKELASKPADEDARKQAQKQAMKAQKEALERQHQKQIKTMQKRHAEELAKAQTQGSQAVQAVQQQHQMETQNLQQQHEQAIRTVVVNAQQQQPTVVVVPTNTGAAAALNPALPIMGGAAAAGAYAGSLNYVTPNPVSTIMSTTPPAVLATPVDDKRTLLTQVGWLPTSTIDDAANRLSVEDLKALYESKTRYAQALAANNNDRNNPSVVLYSQDYFNRMKALRASLGMDLELIRVIEKSGVYGSDGDKVKTLANVLGSSKFSKYRNRIITAAGKDTDNPTNPKLLAAINDARTKTRVGCHGPSHEHLSLWQRFLQPIRITSASYNLIDEFAHYDDLMVIALRKAPRHANINTIAGVPEIFTILLHIHDVVSFLSPEGCQFPPALYHYLVVITKLRLLNAMREDPTYVSTLRNENAVFYNLLREMKGEDVAEAWIADASDHRRFASLLLEHLTAHAPVQVGEHLIRCMSTSTPDDIFTVYLTINRDIDPEHRINIRLRPEGPAVLAPQKPLVIKEQRNNTSLYRDSVDLDHQEVLDFIDLLQHFYPTTAKPYHASRIALHQIRFTNGLIIAKENYPELSRDPKWQKLWDLFQSFISTFYFLPFTGIIN